MNPIRTSNRATLFSLAILILTACAEQLAVDYEAKKARMEAECAALDFKTHYERTKCENNGRLALRKQLDYDTSATYQQYLLERLKIAATLDAKRITPQEAEIQEEQASLQYRQIGDAQEARERQARRQQSDAVMNTLQGMNKPQRPDYQCRTTCDTFGCTTNCDGQ